MAISAHVEDLTRACRLLKACHASRRRHVPRHRCQKKHSGPSASPFRSRRVVSEPEQFPYSFRFHCDGCGNGCSMLWCDECDSSGRLLTKPGGAGVPFKIGTKRCGVCNGLGVVPCPLCGGIEIELPRPDPERGPSMSDEEIREVFSMDWVSRFGEF